MRHIYTVPALVCTLALAVAGCGAQSTNATTPASEDLAASGAQPAAAADPCSFVSKEEVTSVMGEAIIAVKAAGDTCRYETEDADASFVQVDIKQSGGKEEMEIARTASGALGSIGAELKKQDGATGDTGEILAESAAAPKIGDQSFVGANQQLHVLKGDSYFSVSPPHMRSRMSGGNPLLPTEKKREMAAAIAQKIVAKL